MKLRWIAAALAALTLTAGCSGVSTAPDEVALHYEDGPLSSKKFKDCVPVSKREWNGPGDQHYRYPASQRNFNFSGGDKADSAPITIVSSDGIEMAVGGVANFLLNTDCETLRRFHDLIGNRYEAYFNDGTAGWVNMLNVYIGKPLDTAMDRAAQQYTWRALYNDPKTKAAWEKEVNETLPMLVDRQTDGEDDFFRNFTLTISKPEPPGPLKEAITSEQTAVAKAKAAENEARSARLAAEAQVAVARAEAAKIEARIRVLGLDGYLKELAIARGLNPYQPAYGAAVVNPPEK